MKIIKYHPVDSGGYLSDEELRYFSERYQKRVIVRRWTWSDGATGAWDIHSNSWWVHDQLCKDGCWADGSDVTPWQAATVLGDILREEGRLVRATTWKYTTLMLGCKKAHEVVSRESKHD